MRVDHLAVVPVLVVDLRGDVEDAGVGGDGTTVAVAVFGAQELDPLQHDVAPAVPERPSACSDETGSAASCMSTRRWHEVTEFSAPTGP